MRILQLSNKAPYPPNDGSSIAIYNMAKGFIENDCDLTLLTVNTKKHFKPDHEIPEEFKNKSKYSSVFRDANVTPVGAITNLLSTQSYFVSRFNFREYEAKLIDLLKSGKYDVVHIEGLFMAPYIPVIRKYSKAKISIRTHNIEHLIWERMIGNEKNAIKKRYLSLQNRRLKKFELNTLPSVDAIVPITDQDRVFFEELGIKGKYFVSPTGIDLSKYKIDHEKEEPGSIFHFGSMDWMPNTEAVEWFLEKVWKKHLMDVKDCKFYIAGRNMPEQLLNLKMDRVQVIPDVADNIAFYNSKQIMLVPLLSGSGMRIKIIEGMAMGKAIVATSVGAEGIPCTNGKNILNADTPDDFARAVRTLLDNEEKRKTIGANARDFIGREFDNKKLVGNVINFYKSLLN